MRDLQKDIALAGCALVQRQAFAGMIWSKQFYLFRHSAHGSRAIPASRRRRRSAGAAAIAIGCTSTTPTSFPCPTSGSIPGTPPGIWRFTAFRFALIDAEFAKEQLVLLTREWYMHPNGQIPAYEWAFGDVNPPVHAWAAWRVYPDRPQAARRQAATCSFLERVFHKLMLNFTWWVNRKDAEGRNIFQGGFLGLDNIGVFDRSAQLPDRRPHRPGRRHQLDGDVLRSI